MKIATRLKLAALVPVLMALVISVALFVSHRAVQALPEKHGAVRQIITKVNELSSQVSQYLLYHEDRPVQLFLKEQGSLARIIPAVRLSDKNQQARLDEIRRGIESMKNSFLRLVENYRRASSAESSELFKEVENRLAGRLLVQSRAVLAEASTLKRVLDEDLVSTQRRINVLIFAVIVATAFFLTFVLIGLTKNIAASLRTLSIGMEAVGSGDLGHRIGLSSQDEIGELARSFDRMTEHLQGVTVSRNALQQEIEERKRAEEALLRSEVRFRALAESMPNLVWTCTPDGTCDYLSRQWIEYTGISEAEQLGLGWLNQVHSEDRERLMAGWHKTLEAGQAFDIEFRIRRHDGAWRWFKTRAMPTHDEFGHITKWYGSNTDIEDLKQGERALRESEARSKLLSETAGRLLESPDPQRIVNSLCREVMEHLDCHVFFNFLVDELGHRLHLNAFAGIPEEEAKRIEWLDYGIAVCGCVARDGERIIAEDIFRTPDVRTELVKSYGVQAYACHPLRAQDRLIGTLSFGTKTRSHFSSEDLSLMKTVTDQVAVAMERVRLVGQLRRSKDELEMRVLARTADLERSNKELQDFAFIASHDLQEPLRKVQTFGDLLIKRSAASLEAESQDYVRRMQNATARMQKLLESLLSYSRVATKSEPFVKTDLGKSVQSALSNLEIVIKEKGAVVTVDALPEIEADRAQMIQLFQNLIANALKFQKENETPRVKIYSRKAAKDEGGNTGMYEIRLGDNGIGFDEKYLDKIFLPFQRLHGRSGYEGVGMGLAICKKIVERHGGGITAETELGKGSTFIVTLPARQEKR